MWLFEQWCSRSGGVERSHHERRGFSRDSCQAVIQLPWHCTYRKLLISDIYVAKYYSDRYGYNNGRLLELDVLLNFGTWDGYVHKLRLRCVSDFLRTMQERWSSTRSFIKRSLHQYLLRRYFHVICRPDSKQEILNRDLRAIIGGGRI
jgi:hypothetical protein